MTSGQHSRPLLPSNFRNTALMAMRRYARVAPILACLAAATALGWAAPSGLAVAPPPAAGGGTQIPAPVQVSGASRIEYDDASQEWLLTGQHVVAVRDTMRLEAPEIRYNGRTRQFNMPQRGTLSAPTFEITADRIVANLLARHATAEGNITGRFRLFAPPVHASETAAPPWTTFQADQIEADDRPDARQIVAIGDVIVVRTGLLLRQELRGDRVVLNRTAQQGTVDGHADLVFGATRLRADHIFVDQGRREAEATGHVLLDREDMHGSADRGTYSDSAQTAVLFDHVVITRGRDTLTADRVTVHLDQHTAIAEGNPQVVVYPPAESRP